MIKKKCSLQPVKGCKFLAYADAEICHLRESGRFGTARNHASACRRFSNYLNGIGKKDISFGMMTAKLMTDFEGWLKSQNVCRNTSSCYLRSLSAIWNKAVREGFATGTPFAGTYRGVAKTRKRAVSADDIQRLHHLDIASVLTDNGRKTVNRKTEQHIRRLAFSRDLFLFSFCSRGIAFVDMARLRKSNLKGNTISYVRCKTGQRIEVRVEPIMSDIIARHDNGSPYLLPIIREQTDTQQMYREYRNALHLYNKSLRELGRMLGGVPLSSYVSRHSWATIARWSNLPTQVISQALGHDSVQTTEIYLMSLEANIIDEANHTMLENLLRKKV